MTAENTPITELIRSYYRAYETSDRSVVENLLTADFTFDSPLDDRIDRATYLAKCWPGHEKLTEFRLHQIAVEDDHALIRYTAEQSDGSTFTNVEHFHLDGPRISHIDVYFGATP
jgi:hypothetical protein